MMRVYLLMVVILAVATQTHAQRNMRFGYIDMEYILENVDEYKNASAQLEDRAQRWKVELESLKEEIEDMRLNLRNERSLLTHELIEERDEEIQVKEDALSSLQQKIFGSRGDYYTQKRRLVQPIQDQVYTIVQELAEARQYDFIFDKTSNAAMLFAAERHDISDLVLRRIDRASNRREATSRDEEKEIDRRESLTDEQDKELTEREKDREKQLSEREQAIADRLRERDSIRNARQVEFEERRAKILEERQRTRDSIINARSGNKTKESTQEEKPESDEIEEAKEETKETKTETATKVENTEVKDDRESLAEQRKQERDSIRSAQQKEHEERRQRVLDERKRKRDSIINARKQTED